MALRDRAHHIMLDALGEFAVLASLHDGFPATDANELAGGAPAYSRQAITWNPAAARNLDNDANPAFQIPPGAAVRAFALREADGTILGDKALPEELYNGQGEYVLTDADIVSANVA